jgi:hypothetical protein
MKIKMHGEDVDLEYLLSHPRGYQLFVDFLEKEHSSENIQFWHAADRFDEMHKRIWREYQQMESENKPSTDDNSATSAQQQRPSEIKRIGSTASVRRGRRGSNPAIHTWKCLENNIKELHDVCASIIEKYVVDGAMQQVISIIILYPLNLFLYFMNGSVGQYPRESAYRG